MSRSLMPQNKVIENALLPPPENLSYIISITTWISWSDGRNSSSEVSGPICEAKMAATTPQMTKIIMIMYRSL